jgi:hypothetical protein
MGELYRLKDQLLDDRRITDNEVASIREYVDANGKLDLADVKFLVSLVSDAREVSAGFDALFFPALKQVILEDGCVGLDEQFYLMKMLYADGRIRESERNFLRELRNEVDTTTPEFEAMYETAMNTQTQNWSVGGAAV